MVREESWRTSVDSRNILELEVDNRNILILEVHEVGLCLSLQASDHELGCILVCYGKRRICLLQATGMCPSVWVVNLCTPGRLQSRPLDPFPGLICCL